MMEEYIREFLDAVDPGNAELVAATFNEKEVLTQATALLLDYWELKKAHKELLDRCMAFGTWGPWADGWEGSYDQRHWGED